MSTQLLIQLLPLILIAVVIGLFAFYVKRGDVKGGARIIVRCRLGHLFTTIWIPFVSFKAVRLGPVRFQFCPVGQHWAFVTPVREEELSEEEKEIASQNHDSQVP